jgi:hypothetical protein
MPIPLADALVRVRLVADKSDFKAQTSRQVDDATKILRSQIGNLRKEARAFGIIGRDLNKIAATIFKFVVAPTIALGGLGVRKYMQTTEVGAKKLREAMAGLHHSWDQFLARVGRVIYNTGILSKVIERLRHFLNSLDDEKILRILNYAKWAAILGVITKMGGVIFTMTANILKFRAALGTLELLNLLKTGGLTIGKGGVISATKQAAISGATAGGVGAVGVGGIWGSIKALPQLISLNKQLSILDKSKVILERNRSALAALRKEMRASYDEKFMPLFKKGNIPYSHFATSERMAREKYGYGGKGEGVVTGTQIKKSLEGRKKYFEFQEAAATTRKAEIIAPIINAMKTIGKALEWVTKIILLPATALAGLFRGLGFDFKDGIDLIWSGIKGLWMLFKGALLILEVPFKALFASFQSLGIILRNIFTGSFQQMADELENMWHNMIEDIGIAFGNWWTPLEKEQAGNIKSRERKAKDLQFMPKSITTTSFAGLQEAAQEMVNRQEEMDSMSKLTDSNIELDKDIIKLSEEVKKFNKDFPNYGKGSPAGQERDWTNSMSPFMRSYQLNVM